MQRRDVGSFDPEYRAAELEGSVVAEFHVWIKSCGRRVWTLRFRNDQIYRSYTDEFLHTDGVLLVRAIQHSLHDEHYAWNNKPDVFGSVNGIEVTCATLHKEDVDAVEHVYISVDALQYRHHTTYKALREADVCARPECGDWGCESCNE